MDRPGTDKPIEGRYANYFEVGFNAFEVLLLFGQQYAGTGEPVLHTKIVTYPAYALALVDTLQKSIAQYESEFGPIEGPDSTSGER